MATTLNLSVTLDTVDRVPSKTLRLVHTEWFGPSVSSHPTAMLTSILQSKLSAPARLLIRCASNESCAGNIGSEIYEAAQHARITEGQGVVTVENITGKDVETILSKAAAYAESIRQNVWETDESCCNDAICMCGENKHVVYF